MGKIMQWTSVCLMVVLLGCEPISPSSNEPEGVRTVASGWGGYQTSLWFAEMMGGDHVGKLAGKLSLAVDAGRFAWQALGDFVACWQVRDVNPLCATRRIGYPGLCWLLDKAFDQAAPSFGILGLPIEAVCTGDPALKCCKYTGDQGGCHSAFNSDSPVNCEGNPLYLADEWGDYPKSFGVCLPTNRYPGDPGCYCSYLPDCQPPGVPPDDQEIDRAGRFNVLVSHLGSAAIALLESGAPGSVEDFLDFGSFHGCQEHWWALRSLPPFNGEHWPLAPQMTGPTGGYGTFYDDELARYVLDLVTNQVRRVIAGVPNFYGRAIPMLGRLWTPQEVAEAAAVVGDPDAVLLKLLGPYGLELLRQAAPTTYQLMAVPTAQEAPDANDTPYVAACLPGAAPVLTLTRGEGQAGAVRLDVALMDPLEPLNPDAAWPLALDWGDGQVQQHLLVRGWEPSWHVAHAYAVAGAYPVHGWTMNVSGQVAQDQLDLVAPAGVAMGGASSATLSFDADWVVKAHTFGGLSIDVTGIDAHGFSFGLGTHFLGVPAGSTAYQEVRVPLTRVLEHTVVSELTALKLVPMRYNDLYCQRSDLALRGLTLVGPDGSSRTLVPHPDQVLLFPEGATVAQAPWLDQATGELILPMLNDPGTAADPSVLIELGSRPTHDFQGCRRVYDTTNPLYRTAEGGCQDVATGLVWSDLSREAMTWHDAVWDSALAGNDPPDEWDGGLANDYENSPGNGPDASQVDYCHDLEQGGFRDWRLPTGAELDSLVGSGRAGTYVAVALEFGQIAWNGGTWLGTMVGTRSLLSGNLAFPLKEELAHVLCVRTPKGDGRLALGSPCLLGGLCASGHCVDGVCCNQHCGGGRESDCWACSAGAGGGLDGTCVPLAGTACQDGDASSTGDTCGNGRCLPGPETHCPEAGVCGWGWADHASGECRSQPVGEGVACDDGDECTLEDACSSGACLGGEFNPACDRPPVAVCRDLELVADSACSASFEALDVDGGSTDPEGSADIVERVVEPSTVSGTGSHPVTLTVRDAAGQESTCTAVVTVTDVTPPTLVLAPDVAVLCDAVPAAEPPVPEDACTASPVLELFEQAAAGPTPGTRLLERVWTASDDAGNTASGVQAVTVTWDSDLDGCDDCSHGAFAPGNDGTDTDWDGACDAGDPDDDGDGIMDQADACPIQDSSGRDLDGDGCVDDPATVAAALSQTALELSAVPAPTRRAARLLQVALEQLEGTGLAGKGMIPLLLAGDVDGAMVAGQRVERNLEKAAAEGAEVLFARVEVAEAARVLALRAVLEAAAAPLHDPALLLAARTYYEEGLVEALSAAYAAAVDSFRRARAAATAALG